MTYRARALHVQPTIDHIVDYFLDAGSLGRIVPVIHDTCMEVAIANVAEDASEQAKVDNFPFGDFCRLQLERATVIIQTTNR
jgi:hypothetical protein